MKANTLSDIPKLITWLQGFNNKVCQVLSNELPVYAKSSCCGDRVWTEFMYSETHYIDKDMALIEHGEFEIEPVEESERYCCSTCGEECDLE